MGVVMTMLPRAVTVLAGARDYFQLPLALAEADLLEVLVTDLYWPDDREWLGKTLRRVVPGRLIEKRYRLGLSSSSVRLSWLALAAWVVMKMGRSTALNPYQGAVLSRRARDIALDTGAALFAYSTYAMPGFAEAGPKLPYRFLFQMHPHPRTTRAILTDELDRVPWARDSLLKEYELTISQREYEWLCQEPETSNGWVAASSYTADTLAEHGIRRERIHVVPYGVDTRAFPDRPSQALPQGQFRIVYVGSMIQRKGLSYLLEAVKILRSRHIQLILCGRGVIDEKLLAQYAELPLSVRINLDRDELVKEIQASDVFVLPSLTEGFGHVILEAMACGVPVITTAHTCAPDVMREGEHGFIVPVRDAEALANRLGWAIEHRNELASMGNAAAKQARTFSWERFRMGVRSAYERMITSVCL
jgi:glycosyltransferase involved in cell wall biosynthesis